MTVASLEARHPGRPPLASLLELRRAWLSIDANPRAMAFVAGRSGMFVLHAAFLAALAATMQLSLSSLGFVAATLVAAALWPQRRLLVLVGASLLFLALRPFRNAGFDELNRMLASAAEIHPIALQLGAVGAFLVVVRGLLEWQRRGAGSFSRRPVLWLLVAFFGALALFHTLEPGTLLHTGGWAFIAVWASCFWLLAYALADQKARCAASPAMRAAYMRPFWGGDVAPFGKGLSFLSRFEAKDEAELAATRLKALKLAVWTAILSVAYVMASWVVHEFAGVPRLGWLIVNEAEGGSTPLRLRWAALVANYFLDLVVIAVWGHALVAIIRMTGYRIPRNTVNPMASRSVAEFWNRYYYYFKELLVDFFFYPAFLRYFKKSPKLRIAFATVCAAGVGNFLYHLMFESHVFAFGTIAEEWHRFGTLAFYVALLSAGLVISQLRARKPQPADGFWRYHVWPRVNVAAFFCFLKVFDVMWVEGTLDDRFVFVAGLVGA